MDQQKITASRKEKMTKKVDMEHISYFLKTEKMPPDKMYKNKQKRFHFKQRAADFIVDDNKLYYIRPRTSFREEQRTPKRRLVLFSNEDKLQAFYESHINSNGEHNGKNKTSHIFAEKYYVYSLFQMVDALIKNCNVCCQRLGLTDRKNEINMIKILNHFYGENNCNSLLISNDCNKPVVNASSTYIGNEMYLEYQDELGQQNTVIITKENQSEGDNSILQEDRADQDDIRGKSDEVSDHISGKCDKDQDKNQDDIRGKCDKDQADIRGCEDQGDTRGKCDEDQHLKFLKTDQNKGVLLNVEKSYDQEENDVSRKYAKEIGKKNELVDDNTCLDETAIGTQELDHFWHSVELCVFGPYDYWDSEKYVLVFLDLYSMWPEVMIVDTVSPTIVTMGLLNLVCRIIPLDNAESSQKGYNIMKNLYLRDNKQMPFSLFKPNIQLLKSADLDVEIVCSNIDYTEHIWTSMRDHVASYIRNNIDWPSSLSFALIPLRMTCDENGSYSLFINNKRQETNEADLKRRYSSFESAQQKLLKAYRSFSSSTVIPNDTDKMYLSNLGVTQNTCFSTNDTVVTSKGVTLEGKEMNHDIEKMVDSSTGAISDSHTTNPVSTVNSSSDCNNAKQIVLERCSENINVTNDITSRQTNNISRRPLSGTSNKRMVSTRKSIHSDLTDNAKDVSVKPRNKVDITKTASTTDDNTAVKKTGISKFKMRTRSSTKKVDTSSNCLKNDKTVDTNVCQSRKRLYLFDNGKGDKDVKTSVRKKSKSGTDINSSQSEVESYDTQRNTTGGDDNVNDLENCDTSEINEESKSETRSKQRNDLHSCDTSEIYEEPQCVTRSKQDQSETIEEPQGVTTCRSKERNDSENQSVGSELQNCGIIKEEPIISQVKEQEICGQAKIQQKSHQTEKKQNSAQPEEQQITSADLSCDICMLTFKNPGEHKYHMKSHSATLRAKCPKCGKLFRNKNALKFHEDKFHNNTSTVHVARSAVPHSCNICEKVFKTSKLLSSHMRYHKNHGYIVCNICGKIVKKLSIEPHLKLHSNSNRFECHYCFRGFSSADNLTAHINHRHCKKRPPAECPFCKKKYTRKDSMNRHVRARHLNQKPFMCEKCGKFFYRKPYLQSHQKTCKAIECVVLSEPKTVSVNSERKMELPTGLSLQHNINIKPKPETTNERDKISEIQSESDNVLIKTENDVSNVLIQNRNEIGNVVIQNENQIVVEMRDNSVTDLQDLTHCVMYETESGVQYHILLDTPEDGLNNETIAALEMLSKIEATIV